MSEQLVVKEIKKTTSLIEPLLVRLISDHFARYTDLRMKIHYSLRERGLRIRPFLLKMGYEINGKNFKAILPVAIAIELMQTSTLIIDDIIDESKIRNGRDAVYAKWGIRDAILIGELLKSLSSAVFIQSLQKNKKMRRTYKALELFENTYKSIYIGQYLDLSYEKIEIISESQYLDMIKNTTALFIEAPLVIGAILSGVSESLVNSLSSYGLLLGNAYQIRDDVIDLTGEEKYTGKPFAGDIKRQKKRLPIVHAFSNAPKPIKKRLHAIYRKNKISDRDVQEIVTLLYESGSIEYSIKKVKQFCEEAKENLKGIENRRIKNLLFDLAELVSAFQS